MNTRVLVASALALAIATPAAFALDIVNQDKAAYTVQVMPKGGKSTDVAVKANATATTDCKAGCDVTLGGAKMSVDAKTAKIVIKDGKFAAM